MYTLTLNIFYDLIWSMRCPLIIKRQMKNRMV